MEHDAIHSKDNNSLKSEGRASSEARPPRLEVRYEPCEHLPNRSYAHLKRAGDIVVSSLSIIMLAPVLLACAIAVKLTSPGPVLFKQKRWGRSRSQFDCWKFRTMVIETPPNVPAGAFVDKASYMTPCGDFLRRWSLDELPQLFNILKGDMSLIGPRPVIIREVDLIEKREPLNANGVRPGLTGWAQVNGRNLVSNEEKAYLDGQYVANLSFAFDVRIFLKTISVVLSRRGVDKDVYRTDGSNDNDADQRDDGACGVSPR